MWRPLSGGLTWLPGAWLPKTSLARLCISWQRERRFSRARDQKLFLPGLASTGTAARSPSCSRGLAPRFSSKTLRAAPELLRRQVMLDIIHTRTGSSSAGQLSVIALRRFSRKLSWLRELNGELISLHLRFDVHGRLIEVPPLLALLSISHGRKALSLSAALLAHALAVTLTNGLCKFCCSQWVSRSPLSSQVFR
eukprot:4203841-Pleurochrysis_carterae.AAC.1